MSQDSTSTAPSAERLRLRLGALSRWENEGGAAGPDAVPAADVAGSALIGDSTSAGTEAVQLRIRVIALENLVISLLAQAPVAQLALAREIGEGASASLRRLFRVSNGGGHAMCPSWAAEILDHRRS